MNNRHHSVLKIHILKYQITEPLRVARCWHQKNRELSQVERPGFVSPCPAYPGIYSHQVEWQAECLTVFTLPSLSTRVLLISYILNMGILKLHWNEVCSEWVEKHKWKVPGRNNFGFLWNNEQMNILQRCGNVRGPDGRTTAKTRENFRFMWWKSKPLKVFEKWDITVKGIFNVE